MWSFYLYFDLFEFYIWGQWWIKLFICYIYFTKSININVVFKNHQMEKIKYYTVGYLQIDNKFLCLQFILVCSPFGSIPQSIPSPVHLAVQSPAGIQKNFFVSLTADQDGCFTLGFPSNDIPISRSDKLISIYLCTHSGIHQLFLQTGNQHWHRCLLVLG